ncbi:MAG: branched-chain amino acid ABC transporter permease [Acidimicrobiia bacterium]
MRGRPLLYTAYEEEQSLLPTATQRWGLGALVFLAVLLPLGGLKLWFIDFGFLGNDDWLIIINQALIWGIAALGLNLLTGVAGQVSLGHAFFMAVGAYTAVVLGGSGDNFWGLGLPIWIWLPMAGVVPALVGIIVAPTAVRVRGLYLAIVTLGLVFVGEHLWRNLSFVAGGPTTGRHWPALEIRFWKEQNPLLNFSTDGDWFGIFLTDKAKTFYLLLALLIVFTLIAKNLIRTRVGRSWAAIRDRDIAAEIMGVGEAKGKLQAFAVSSFFAGIGGALIAAVLGVIIPEFWSLQLSVEFIAIILIGGAGTVAGTLMGSFFVTDPATNGGWLAWLADPIIAEGSDRCCISTAAAGPGLSVFDLNVLLFGILIVVFLIAEPLGLYGIWIRVRNYWKGWPFTY